MIKLIFNICLSSFYAAWTRKQNIIGDHKNTGKVTEDLELQNNSE
jgi:hypothetical protein